MDKFEEQLLDILEVDELLDDTVLEELEAWDSLAVLSIISLAGSEYNKKLSAAEVKTAKTVGELKKVIAG